MSGPAHPREALVSKAFVLLADSLVDDYDMIDLLDRLVGYCVQLLAADAAAIVLADPREELRVVASSSEDAELMELLQLQSDQGPCLDCYRSAAPVSVPDLSEAGSRWPLFVATLNEREAFRSVHALPLRLRGKSIGALNLFHRLPGALPDDDLALGQALADVATIAILQERAVHRGEVLNEQLQNALNSRVIIEQAKGVLAQSLDLDMNAAFERLRRYARNRGQRLGEVARKLVDGELGADAIGADTSPRTVRPALDGQ